jgi:hypothetical protein
MTTQPDTDAPPTLYDLGFAYGADPASHQHIDGCGHSGEGVDAEFMRGWRAGRKPSDAPQEGRPTTPQTEADDEERTYTEDEYIEYGMVQYRRGSAQARAERAAAGALPSVYWTMSESEARLLEDHTPWFDPAPPIEPMPGEPRPTVICNRVGCDDEPFLDHIRRLAAAPPEASERPFELVDLEMKIEAERLRDKGGKR